MLTAALLSQSSALACSTEWKTKRAALLTRTWMCGPNLAAVRLAALLQSSSLPMSEATQRVLAAGERGRGGRGRGTTGGKEG
jgi:hypothetical protein